MTDLVIALPVPLSSSPEEELPDMTFSSSPVRYPPSSLPEYAPAPKQKRKLFQTLNEKGPLLKKPKLVQDDGPVPALEEPGLLHIIPANEHKSSAEPLVDDPIASVTADADVGALYADIDDLDLPELAPTIPNLGRGLRRKHVEIHTESGKTLKIASRKKQSLQTYEQIIADRSVTAAGRATRAYYGIEIHKLVDDAKIQHELDKAAKEVQAQKDADLQPTIERPSSSHSNGGRRANKHQMWTEKYRAKKFTELVGDERTHRSVLKWLKAWDSVVFPSNARAKPKRIYEDKDAQEQQHRKIMLLTGPPGLGKTTLAHVCAKQAGYEVLEINASDDRSRDVVKGRIKDALATETVRGIQEPGKTRKAGKPVCVVVDEVDGVVTGSGGSGGEGGFMKALIDLVQLDQKNCSQAGNMTGTGGKKKGDKFKLLRPLILICNDVYAPSLRPLRNSSVAEIVHVRKPPLDKVIARLKTVFERENIRCDNDAVRRLCESSWGLGTRKQNSVNARGTGDGDIRGVLVQGEWMAHKLRVDNDENRLTRKWLESQIADSSSTGQKGLGRGGVREVVERVFIEGAGLSTTTTTLSADDARQIAEAKTTIIGVADLRKRAAINALREMINTTGDHDKLMTDCWATYPTQVYQDDTFLSKPCSSYDWLHFHDSLSRRVFAGQEWELTPYLSTSACAFHDLFSAVDKGATAWGNQDNEKQEPNEEELHPFSGLKADYAAYEAEKQNRTVLTEMQSHFSGELLRFFSSTDVIATELIPNVNRILAPDVKPVVIGGSGGGPSVASVRKESERNCISSAVRVMNALGIQFEKVRIETEGYATSATGGFALRMEP